MNKKVKELLIIFAIIFVLNELFALVLIPGGFMWQIQLFTLGRTLVSTAIVYAIYIVIKKYWQENKD